MKPAPHQRLQPERTDVSKWEASGQRGQPAFSCEGVEDDKCEPDERQENGGAKETGLGLFVGLITLDKEDDKCNSESEVVLAEDRDALARALELDADEELLAFYGNDVLAAYKRVDRRVKPVPGVFPEDARVEQRFPEDPLASLAPLTMHPPDFKPGKRLTRERLDEININSQGFLWPEEEKLFEHILRLNENALAFEESQRGTFREDYF
ncbi:hypothetical protein EVJ58_g9918, partial [Rhodofomes roseus]